MLMPEFIAHKRDVFLIALMCGRKNKEITDLANETKTQEQNFLDTEAAISEMSTQYKMATAHLEANLARARKATEGAARARMDIQKQYKLMVQSSAAIRSDIVKNEDNLERYRLYDDFLTVVAHDKPDGFRNDPKNLIQELEDMEDDNLFIIGQYEQLRVAAEKRLDKVSSQIVSTDAHIKVAAERAASVPDFSSSSSHRLSESDTRAAEKLDAEIREIRDLITQTYIRCFGKAGNLSSIMMLEQIENALERLYQKMKVVNPVFAGKKQKKKDEERMERRRLDALEQKAAEQKLKVEQALARATKPRKLMTGRPMMNRMLPIVCTRPNEEKLRADLMERERLEALLYGIEDD
jgi:hypothetical protein